MTRKHDPLYVHNDIARCVGRVRVSTSEDFVSVLDPECELCLRRAPLSRGVLRYVSISPWAGSGPCPDRIVWKDEE